MVYIFLFCVGGVGYGIIEILWRGYTHWTMMILGGISFLAIYYINIYFFDMGIILKAILGAAFITLAELVTGIIVNIVLKWDIWNYSKLPFNVKGQICLLYSVFWIALCFVLIPICNVINNKIYLLK